MVECFLREGEGRLITCYEVQVTWRTYDAATSALLGQAAIRQDLALRLSIESLGLPRVFERYDISNPSSNTSRNQLRSLLLDEARRLMDLAHTLLHPDVTADEQAEAMAMVAEQYADLSDLQVDSEALAHEWVITSWAAPARGGPRVGLPQIEE